MNNVGLFGAWWGLAALAIILFAASLGRIIHKDCLWILIDTRGRYSLSQLQVVLWTILILSLWVAVVIITRGTGSIAIPSQLLALMGISVGSVVTATAIKAGKDQEGQPQRERVKKGRPKFCQVFLVEEGDPNTPDVEIIDVTKFQNFIITLVIVAVYIATVFSQVNVLIGSLTLPPLSDSLVALLGISHAGYLGGKLPNR